MPVKISEKKLLSIGDKKIFDQFLSIKNHELSPYNFANIYVWKSLFEIFWYLIDDALCVFFNNSGGCFMYLSPLTANINENIIKQCFKIMDEYNSNHSLSRIENVPEKEIGFYQKLGLVQKHKSSDYLYLRTKIAELKGNSYKAKRADRNYFTKTYKFAYQPYLKADEQECILLLKNWIENRKLNNQDQLYQYMLDDIFSAQQIALKNCSELGLIARVVLIEGKVAGYTFGYELNPDTFCIMFEVVNHQFKGISQFVFQKFALEMKAYKYINTMDDSDLENLTRVKLSYKPEQLVRNALITREL
ncbi:MAG: phosphatidylglycerol lysyltransferase domain-containing protein [Candidatus Omnitrophota bacterium]